MAPRGLPPWVERLHLEWWRYALPFAFGPPPKRETGTGIHAGTCCAVELGDARFLLTAAHVLAGALEALAQEPTQVIAGPLNLVLDPSRARLNEPWDIATFPLTAAQVAAIERDGHRIIRPTVWPPREPQTGDGVLLAGYPGAWRLPVSWNEVDFRATTLLVLVHSVHDRYFMCHRDPDYSDQVRVGMQEDVPGLDLAGCSGGPVFLVRNESGELLAPELCGLVSQDRPVGDHILLQLARLHTVQTNGDIGLS
jgi:hypothetical protein